MYLDFLYVLFYFFPCTAPTYLVPFIPKCWCILQQAFVSVLGSLYYIVHSSYIVIDRAENIHSIPTYLPMYLIIKYPVILLSLHSAMDESRSNVCISGDTQLGVCFSLLYTLPFCLILLKCMQSYTRVSQV